MLTHQNTTPTSPDHVTLVGAGGFVGRHIKMALDAKKIETTALTRTECDLTSGNSVDVLKAAFAKGGAVVITSAIAPCKTPDQTHDNIMMIRNVCAALQESDAVTHVVYISSDAVYDDADVNISETSPAAPTGLHGAMHVTREIMLSNATKAPVALPRPSLLYGAGDPHNGYGPNRFRRQAKEGEVIKLFGEGEEQRDHVYIDDLAALVGKILDHQSEGILNIATGTSTSFRDVAERAVVLAGTGASVKGTPRQNPIVHRHFDTTALHKAFPDFTYTDLAKGMMRAMASET